MSYLATGYAGLARLQHKGAQQRGAAKGKSWWERIARGAERGLETYATREERRLAEARARQAEAQARGAAPGLPGWVLPVGGAALVAAIILSRR